MGNKAKIAGMDRAYGRIMAARAEMEMAAGAPAPYSPRRERHRRPYGTPVTITLPDGTTIEKAAYTPSELRVISPERPPISQRMRLAVLRRDRWACRYCGNMAGPFELDHVLPVSMGGPTTMRNLVTACRTCNQRKGASIWRPKPLG